MSERRAGRSVFCVDSDADQERAKMAAAGHSTGERERKVPRWEPKHNDPCDPKVTGPEVWQQSTNAHSICSRAAQIVDGDRAVQHGPKERNHKNIADHWNAYLTGRLDRPLTPIDVALMMVELKIARTKAGGGLTNLDNYVDGAGYFGIAGEIALNDREMP